VHGSNIGTRDNALARLSSKETPPAFGFGEGGRPQRGADGDVAAGSSERGEDYSKRSHEVPGPASYRPQALTVLLMAPASRPSFVTCEQWIGGHGQNKSLRVRGERM